ncbi:MAG: hypothetical protein M1839_003175 [Geoglossum umbratile]|nr:MAG: hypothetical protein M1839_003175 [Geoglossum umbratile]
MDAVQTLGYMAAQSGKSIKEVITDYLRPWTKERQLDELLKIFNDSYDLDEIMSEVVSEAWNYIQIHELWTIRYQNLESLRRDLQYDEFVAKRIDHHKAVTSRKRIEGVNIYKTWGCLPQDAFPDSISPPSFSDNLLRGLNQLSKHRSLKEAILLLETAIRDCLDDPDAATRSKSIQYLTPNDVTKVLNRVKYGGGELANTRESDCTCTDAEASPNLTTGPSVEGERSGGKDEDCGNEDEGKGGDGTDENGGDGGGGNEEYEVGESEGDGDGRSEEDGEARDGGVEKGEVRRGTRKRGRKKRGQRKRGTEGEVEADNRTTAVCRCPAPLAQDIQGMKGKNDDLGGLKLLGKAIKAGLRTLCHTHLRALAPVTAGLQNNISNSKLQERLQLVWTNQQRLDWLRRRKPRWFLKNCRPQPEADCLAVYRYFPLPASVFQFNEVRVFERFAGRGTWSIWEQDGTIIIPELFSFLAELSPKIDMEFDLYRHHHCSLPGRSRLGWLRNMFYSIIQQTVRQDPIWYAISAAARPDKNWRLVTYPYITKDTDPGENTGFLHLDLNTTQYVKDGSGGNLLSSSIAIDDEQPDGCTIVVPGFHHHIHEWHKRLIDRGEDTAGFTTNCSAAYRAQDRRDWGEPVPMPCPALGLRLTRPEIIHGSTPHSYRRRRSLFAWHTGIDDTHIKLDLKGTLSWNDLATCHRDLEAPSREPSGQAPRYGLPGFRFPGSIIVGSSSAIGDALVGRRKWTDPQVLQERDILLGDNNKAAHSYVSWVRAEMVKRFKEAFEQLEVIETKAFGENSYFHRKKFGLPIRSGNDSEESDEDSPV